MALGMSQYLANELFDAIGNNGSFAIIQVYIKLHLGDPGSAGTANPAGETTRQAASFATATGGTMTTDAAITWTSVSTSEQYTHYSAWDAATAGNFLWSDTLSANAVSATEDFTIPAGDLDLAINLAA
jgi:hypothetical protein